MTEYSRTHTRQLDVLPEESLNKQIAIIGLGGIGSPTAYILAKMGMRALRLYDFDKVDTHNISTQFYSLEDVGAPKAMCLAERIAKELGVGVLATGRRIEELPETEIVIVAVDSMDERIKLWKTVSPETKWYIEARMGLEQARIYAFSPYDSEARESYEKNLYPSSEAVELPCSARAIVYNTFFIGSMLALIVKRIITGQEPPFETFCDLDKMGMRTFRK